MRATLDNAVDIVSNNDMICCARLANGGSHITSFVSRFNRKWNSGPDPEGALLPSNISTSLMKVMKFITNRKMHTIEEIDQQRFSID